VISRLGVADAGELMTLQRAAYVTEAQLHHDMFLPPLTEPLEDVVSALESNVVLGVREDGRLVGAVRAREVSPGVVEIGRLAVAPDRQGRGLGTALLQAAEAAFGDVSEWRLFTGEHSDGNLRLYARLGYRETGREDAGGHDIVHLAKRP
jgi:ribosomal protein S18 acetylase RimI-like enzyme